MPISQDGFKYVIQKQEQQKVCFGSGCPRDTSKKGMSPFMRSYALEDHPNVAPNSYDTLQSFKAIKSKPCSGSISKKGYSGIARFSKPISFKDYYPSPCDYDVFPFRKPVHKSKYPFDSNTKRRTFVFNKNPGPGMYVVIKKTDSAFEHSFGGRVKMKLGVDLKCCSKNTDVCKLCGRRPLEDYWHLRNEVFLCRQCMDKEYTSETKYRRAELKKFRKIRDCSILHRHETTTAKIWLMHPKDAAQWIRREAYLSAYFTD